jgi:hypothetical protein
VKRVSLLVIVVASAALLAGCGSSGSSAPSASPGRATTAQPSTAPGNAGSSAAGDTSAQFGGDVCSALTKADIEAATFPQGVAKFVSTDTQKDATTGKAVVCQYLVVFGGKPSIVGAFVTLLTDDEQQHRKQVALTFTPEPVSGIGTEASVVQAAPGLYEVWVNGPNGKFTVGAQDKATAIALAKLAVARN